MQESTRSPGGIAPRAVRHMMPTMPAPSDEQFMRQALRLARRGEGRVEPNPMVGAVLVRRGKVVGAGWHRRCGGPHAEIHALRQAGGQARGATLYVTLEPCCHHGKTPPCTQAVLAAGVQRVVVAMVDPFPQVAGAGIKQLRAAGVQVDVGLGEAEAQAINAPFVRRVTAGRPWVIAKWASTLDGKIAARSGDSKWISNEDSRALVHGLRGRVDAILTGIGTVLADDPLLTARLRKARNPDAYQRPCRIARRVVVDPRLRLPLECQLLATLDRAPLTVAMAADAGRAVQRRAAALAKRGVEIVPLPPLRARAGSPGKLDLSRLLQHLTHQHQATNVLVEAGPGLVGALLARGLIDQVWAFIAPKLLGDAAGRAPVEGFTRSRIADSSKLRLQQVRRVGDDVLLDYRVSNP